jgi:1,4-alpha-glucan branching enzyme
LEIAAGMVYIAPTEKSRTRMSQLQSYSPGSANRYSAKQMRKPVNFVCAATTAKQVFVLGDFNQWDARANPMRRQPDGAWTVQLQLNHGHHQYQFLVDGQPTLDPRAQGVSKHPSMGRVSIIAVS